MVNVVIELQIFDTQVNNLKNSQPQLCEHNTLQITKISQ